MRKPAFCICENKAAGQSCAVTMQMISAFVYATKMVQSLYFLNWKIETLTIFCGCTARFVSDHLGNLEDRLYHDAVHLLE